VKKLCDTLLIPLLIIAQATWAAATLREVDIDGTQMRFEYSQAPTQEGHRASLLVKDAEQRELWSHSWEVEKSDLIQMMDEAGRSSAEEWGRRFFDNKPFQHATFERRKLTTQDLAPRYLAFHAKSLKVSAAALQAAILEPKVNFTFTYLGAWREELYQMVYVPKYRRFVQFTGYPGEE